MASKHAYVHDYGRPIDLTARIASAPVGWTAPTLSMTALKPSNTEAPIAGDFVILSDTTFSWTPQAVGTLDESGTWILRPHVIDGAEHYDCDDIAIQVGALQGAASVFPPAAPTVFDPTDIDGCVLWLRADTGITLVGAGVSSWAGIGATLVQAVAGNRPTVAGNYVVFDAALVQSLAGAFAIAAASEFDLWVVLYCAVPTTPTMAPLNAWRAGVANTILLRQSGATSLMQLEGYGSIGGGVRTVSVPVSGTGGLVLNMKHASRQMTGLANGVAVAMSTTENILNAGDMLKLGDYQLGAFAWSGGYAEIAMYNRALSINEHSRLSDYVRGRYNFSVVP